MSWIDKIKVLFLVLQKGKELGNVETYKNLQAAAALLAVVIAGLLGAFHVDLDSAIIEAASYGLAGIIAVVLYLIPATSARMGLPAKSKPDAGAADPQPPVSP